MFKPMFKPMFKQLLKPVYRASHDLLNACQPLWPQEHGGLPVGKGHISDEHLADPGLDDLLARQFQQGGIPVIDYRIDVSGYHAYVGAADYPADYYGGGTNAVANNFIEKTLEHYVSLDFLDLQPDEVFIDIAACTSPFYRMVKQRYGLKRAYQQDLVYPKGLHGDKMGGYASELGLPDESVSAVSLHCSLEHFEGNSDTAFFQELERVLKPGGRAIILPFYLAHTYTIHVDPAYNLLKGHRPRLDPKAQLRHCDWYQFFSRHYDPVALQERVLDPAPGLKLRLHRVRNFREVHPTCYLRWIGVFEKESGTRS